MNKSIKKRGAPVTVDGKRFNVYLDGQSVEKAKQIGNGNISEGIRTALTQFNKDLSCKTL